MPRFRRSLAVALLCLLPAIASAQSPAPFPLDMQCQWREVPVPLGIIDPGWQHTHVQTWPLLYQQVGDLVRVPFAVMLRNTAGFASVDLGRQEVVTKIEWDDIGESAYREMRGDPHAIVMWHGHITYDPRKKHDGHEFPLKGWYSPQFEVNTFYDTGANILQLVKLPFYSVVDPTAPDGSLSGYPVLLGSCYPHSPRIKEWGTNYIEVDNFLPVSPIAALWQLITGTAAYGGNEIGVGRFDVRVDFDLHNGNPGRLIQSLSEALFKSADRAPVLDPVVLGPGSHPVALIWSKPTKDDSEEVVALLKFTVVVDPNAPPVLLCQDSAANNIGQPLPCTFTVLPPPSPVEEWRQVFPLYFEDFVGGVSTGKFKVCFGAVCFPLN